MTPTRVAIGTHRYMVDLSQAVRRPLATMRQAVDQGARQGEQSLDNSALWKRTCSDFVLGQGQAFYDQEEEADERRCRAVQNFDPLSERRELATSINFGAAFAAFTASGNYHRLLRTPSNFWWGSGSQLHRSGSHLVFTTTSITGGPGTSSFRDMCTFGNKVYVAYSSDVYSGTATGTSVSLFSTQDCDVINADLGRLIGGKGPALFELDSAGAKIDIFTHPNPQWNWTAFAAGNAGIYAAGTDGLKSEIYLITVIDATGALAPPFPVAQLPLGELIRRMAYFGGFLVICTSVGVRTAQAAQSGLLSYGPVIRLGDTKGVSFEGRFAYVACSSIPTFGSPGVVALSLERFTAPLTPAYAAVAAFNTATAYVVQDVANYEGLVCALMSTGGNNTVMISNTTNPNPTYGTGKYWSGQVTYGTPEPKQIVSLELVFDPLPAGTSVTAEIWDKQGGTQYGSATVATVGATSLMVEPSTDLSNESCEVYIAATGASGGKRVVIRRWTLRGIVAPAYVAEEIILPLMLSSEVLADNGQIVNFDPEAEWQYLTGLMRNRTQVELSFGNETSQVWVDQVGVEQGWVRWDDRDQWPEGSVLVRLITIGQR